MNFKKEMALKQDTEEFLITLNRLNMDYTENYIYAGKFLKVT